MASKQRNTPSPSPPTPHASKLSKFLQKQTRDRSKSESGHSSVASSSSSSLLYPELETRAAVPAASSRKTRGFLGGVKNNNNKDDKTLTRSSHPDTAPDSEQDDTFDEPPVIVEPQDMPRRRGDRPHSTFSEVHPSISLYSSSSSNRISDLPTRLSGWLSHTFSTSSTDLSLPSLLSQSHLSPGSSPKGKASALITVAKHGKGHLDRAMRFLMDSDSTPDKCSEPIWLLGVQHPGYEPPPPTSPGRRSSTESRRSSSFRSSTASSQTLSPYELSQTQLSQSQPPSSKNPGANWPPVFYADFTSRIWLTYRSQFQPIRDSNLSALDSDAVPAPQSPAPRRWNWGGEKGWTSDAGWGCMLRTGQSLLANALLHLHLGRDWRRPPYPLPTADYAAYVQIVTWFLDTPSPQAPFSVHRMALAGKELGKDVGQWFGPSTAAGAIKTLVHSFPPAGLGVAVAVDGVIFQSDVYAASQHASHISNPNSPHNSQASSSAGVNSLLSSPKRHHDRQKWGGRAVLVLIGIRLGIDGVNPIYYEAIKALYTFPQSVGIAGGRPSSSYYFMGSQADNLFYLDPHHARPAIPLRTPPTVPSNSTSGSTTIAGDSSSLVSKRLERESTPPDDDKERRSSVAGSASVGEKRGGHYRSPTSPSSVRTGSSTFSYHAPMSPSPLQHQLSNSSSVITTSDDGDRDKDRWSQVESVRTGGERTSVYGHMGRWQNASVPASPNVSAEMDVTELGWGDEYESSRYPSARYEGKRSLDPLVEHYVTAYSPEQLKTFHCDRVRKMPLSGLDPSMLLGFLCKDEADWVDLRRRVGELSQRHKTIFSIQDEPPNWTSDSDDLMGLESISDPEDIMDDVDAEATSDHSFNDEGREGTGAGEEYFDTRSPSTSPDASLKEGGKSSEVDTEEDPIGPITPGPSSGSFDDRERVKGKGKDQERFDEDEEGEGIEDDWVDPSLPTPVLPTHKLVAPPMAMSKSNGSTSSTSSKGKGKKKKTKKSTSGGVPIVKSPTPPEHFPFPRSLEESFHGETGSVERRMNNARARDGGRTQSGGVKGILTDDGELV